MAQFKQIFTPLLRLHPKYRRALRQCAPVTSTLNTAVAYGKPNSTRQPAHPAPECTVLNVQQVQPLSGTDPEDVGEVGESDSDSDSVCKTPIEVEVQTVELLPEAIPPKVEETKEFEDGDEDEHASECDSEYDEYDEDEDVPEVFSYDLAHKTRNEMMIKRLYVALTDDDDDIAALRTRDRRKFTHIVRVAFKSPSPNSNIMPSSWTAEEIHLDDGQSELRLSCPALTRRYTDKLTALTEKQLLAARDYITRTLPDRNDEWAARGIQLPLSPEQCRNARVLIVAPSDRSVDVMTVLVCYLAFLTGQSANSLPAGIRKLALVHNHWKGNIISRDSLDMADAVSRQKWKW